MTSIPPRLFHATWPTRLQPILTEGIRGMSMGDVYLAGKPEHAAGFLRMRGGEYLGIKTVTITVDHIDVEVNLPDLIQHDHIIVIEIDPTQLDPTLLEQSDDHAAFFAPADMVAWTFHGDIPAAAITGHTRHGR